jgi:hypothetical protein
VNTIKTPKKAEITFDELVKSPEMRFSVIPAESGIQYFQIVLDPGFRRGDA